MRSFSIVSDTSHDLEENYLIENDIKAVPFYVSLDGKNYLKDQEELTREELYKFLRENPDKYPKTSLPSVENYLEAFKEELEKGNKILCFTVSSTLSGSNQSANLAKNLALEEYPEGKIYVLDTKSASLGTGLLMKYGVELRKAGIDIEKASEILEEISKSTGVFIALDTLSYLVHGGRIGKVAAFTGNLLNLKPIVSFKNSELNLEDKVRGSKRAVRKTIDLVIKDIEDEKEDYEIFIVHGDNLKGAREVAKEFKEKYDIQVYKDLALVAPAMISHVGPGAIAIGYIKKYRV